MQLQPSSSAPLAVTQLQGSGGSFEAMTSFLKEQQDKFVSLLREERETAERRSDRQRHEMETERDKQRHEMETKLDEQRSERVLGLFLERDAASRDRSSIGGDYLRAQRPSRASLADLPFRKIMGYKARSRERWHAR